LKLKDQFVADRRSQAIGAVGTALLGLLFWWTPLGRGLVDLSYDLPFRMRLDVYTDEVAIVHLDEASRRELQQTSFEKWDRDLHAQFLQRMIDWKARAVVLDLPFDQPTPNDQRFLQTVALGKLVVGAFRPPLAAPQNNDAVVAPFPALQRVAAWGTALSGAQTDVIRRHDREWPNAPPPLPWKAAQIVLGKAPLPASAPRWIYYYGPPGVFSSFSYADVLQDRLPAEVFSNKVVFVGVLGLTNAPPPAGGFRTPYTRWRHVRSSGAEIEATRFLNLVRGDWLTRLSAPKEFLLIAGLGVLFGWTFGLSRPLRSAGMALLAFLLVTGTALWLTWQQRVWWSWMIVVCAQIPLALGWSAVSVTRRLSREMRELEKALATDDTAEKLLASSPPAAPTPSTPVTDPGHPAPPPIPNHQLLRCIGRGAYGEVWLARDDIGVFRAVKLVFRSHFKDKSPFEREYRGILQYTPLSRTHHGLVQILHLGRDLAAGFFFYVMELADCEHGGRNIDPRTYSPRHLARELDHRGQLPAVECVRLGVELAEALSYLHSRQLVHRDIKPANIIYVNNVPKLADVGLVAHFAEARRDDKKLGTEGFVPPEGPGTPTADVYSLGKVLCEASLGRAAATSAAPPDLPADRAGERGLCELVAIFSKACDEDLARRYKSIQEMQADLMVLHDLLSRAA
jgi:CHASE2 domain-containing sensor protein